MTTSNTDIDRPHADRVPKSAAGATPKQKIKEDARDAKREVTAEARDMAEDGQKRIADGADALSDAIDAAASSLDDHDRDGLARYARELSSNLADAAGQLEGRSVDELAQDAKRLARDNPAMFMLGSIAVGFGLSRFFKASAKHEQDDASSRDVANTRASPVREGDGSIGTPTQPRERGTTNAYAETTAPRSDDGREMR